MITEMVLIAQSLFRHAEGLRPTAAITIILHPLHATCLREIFVTLLALARLLEI